MKYNFSNLKRTVFFLSLIIIIVGTIQEVEANEVIPIPQLIINGTHFFPGETIELKIFNVMIDEPVLIEIPFPIKDIGDRLLEIYPIPDSLHDFLIHIPPDAPAGTYPIFVQSCCKYKSDVGKTVFTILEKPETGSSVENMYAESNLPEWIRTIFYWYGKDKISEPELLEAIKWLVENDVIKIGT